MKRVNFRKTGIAAILLLALIALSGCGGGGGGGGTSGGSTGGGGGVAITSFNLSGSVNGTIIEAFGDNGSYYRTESVNSGTPQHEFTLTLPVGMGFRLVMTTNENGPGDPVVAPIGFPDGSGGTTIVFLSDGQTQEVEIGHIELYLVPGDVPAGEDSNGDGVLDNPKQLATPSGIETRGTEGETTPQDDDGDGIINVYDSDHDEDPTDSDDDGIPDEADANPTNNEEEDNELSSDKDSDGDGYHDDDADHDGLPDNGGGSTGGGTTNGNGYTLLAWNDLGMHCMDSDYSVFSILPPFNTINAQLVANGERVTSGVTLTYEATPDLSGSTNSTSALKTNFWDFDDQLFGSNLSANEGLAGFNMASTTPQEMHFNATHDWFNAEGVPITPYDDTGKFNPYPMIKVVARDTNGTELASAQIVAPVSDEMSCISCHASTTDTGPAGAAEPDSGWVMDDNAEIDFRKNVLAKHDEHLGDSIYDNALASMGFDAAGLLATVETGQPILCAGCHASNALPGTGLAGISPLTQAIHSKHATVEDPSTLPTITLDESSNRDSCYLCHPGTKTDCLRGAMGNAKDTVGKHTMECQACHGSMSSVGSSERTGWLEQPNCQSCHNNGERLTMGVDGNGKPLSANGDLTFATNADTPAAGVDLYRFSTGHGGLQCEACHGSTHSIYPSNTANDNVLSLDLQGYAGTISDCAACHEITGDFIENSSPADYPHGMHPANDIWVDKHGDIAENDTNSCAYCHGSDYRGTPLSEVKTDRNFNTEDGQKSYNAGDQAGCYDCHNGPDGED